MANKQEIELEYIRRAQAANIPNAEIKRVVTEKRGFRFGRPQSAFTSPESQRIYRDQRSADEVAAYGRELTNTERGVTAAVSIGAPIVGAVVGQVAAPELPIIGGAIGAGGGTALGDIQLQRYYGRQGLRKKPPSIGEALAEGGKTAGWTLALGGLLKGGERLLGRAGSIPPAGNIYLEKKSILGSKAAFIKPAETAEEGLVGKVRGAVDVARKRLTPGKVRMNQIVSTAESSGVRVDPTKTIEALLAKEPGVVGSTVAGQRQAEQTAQRILNETGLDGKIAIKRFESIVGDLRKKVATKFGAINNPEAIQLHKSGYAAAKTDLENALPGHLKPAYLEAKGEVAVSQMARKTVQQKVGTTLSPKMSGISYIRNVAKNTEQMAWLKEFNPKLAADVEYLATRRMLTLEDRTKAGEVMGIIRTIAMPFTRFGAKAGAMAIRPAVTGAEYVRPFREKKYE